VSRVLVDTSAWAALTDRDDRGNASVKAVLSEMKDRLATTNFILDETLTLLRYHVGWTVARAFGEQIRAGRLAQQIRVMPSDEEAAWDIFVRYRDHAFSFTDCTSFAVMRRLGIDTAVTTDSDFRSFGFHCLP
jgi:predicted nucleic acid-binding protein